MQNNILINMNAVEKDFLIEDTISFNTFQSNKHYIYLKNMVFDKLAKYLYLLTLKSLIGLVFKLLFFLLLKIKLLNFQLFLTLYKN
jgi:hypothetical protein